MRQHNHVGHTGSRWRLDRAFYLIIAVWLCGPHASAQNDLAALRKLLKAGDDGAVLARVKQIAAGDGCTTEIALVGAEAALKLMEWGQAGSLGSLATELCPKDEDGRPSDHRGFEMEAHALWGSAQAVLQSGRGSGLTRATFLDAGSFYRLAREHGGDTFKNGYWEAQAHRYGMSFEQALIGIQQALAAQPENWDARILQARVFLDLARFEDAQRSLRALRKLQPLSTEAAHLLFAAALGTNDKRSIKDTFLELIRAFPRDMAIYRPFHDRFQNDAPALVEATLRAITGFRTAKEDPVPWFYLSLLAERGGRNDEALALMTEYRDATPRAPEGHYQVARLSLRLNRHRDAHAAMLKANALGGLQDADMARGFGWVISAYAAENAYEPAIALQKIVVSLLKDAAEELNLARLMFHGGKRSDAIALVERLLLREAGFEDPLIAEMENDLALYHLGSGEAEKAEKGFRRSMSASVEKLDATENLAIFLLERGRQDEGIALLERCLATEPGRHRSRYHLMRARHPALMGAPTR